ncbi:hypothetical protein SAMN05660209_04890 [Geodermatophilus africanus]|uniref:Uncharacterized protein n=1 Tax=Geodermatophilus africanus TaxID=1137993 RepID=A0A1H3QTI7_9ACTN|nr:hypothetical protein SAMN05660209_04890 [Geodermatophilus africanus]
MRRWSGSGGLRGGDVRRRVARRPVGVRRLLTSTARRRWTLVRRCGVLASRSVRQLGRRVGLCLGIGRSPVWFGIEIRLVRAGESRDRRPRLVRVRTRRLIVGALFTGRLAGAVLVRGGVLVGPRWACALVAPVTLVGFIGRRVTLVCLGIRRCWPGGPELRVSADVRDLWIAEAVRHTRHIVGRAVDRPGRVRPCHVGHERQQQERTRGQEQAPQPPGAAGQVLRQLGTRAQRATTSQFAGRPPQRHGRSLARNPQRSGVSLTRHSQQLQTDNFRKGRVRATLECSREDRLGRVVTARDPPGIQMHIGRCRGRAE